MIRHVTVLLFLTILLTTETESQVILGRLIDETSTPIPNAILRLYSTPDVYDTVSTSTGNFIFVINRVTGVESSLPTGYAVTNNFPNPFNPKTRIGISLPARGKVKLEVFDMLGERVYPTVEKTFEAGNNFIDVDLNGLANGMYISRLTIDDKIVTTRKMMLLYGSQHLNTSGSVSMGKVEEAAEVIIDSLVVWTDFARKTFTNLPAAGDTLNLGDLVIERFACPSGIVYEGRTYETIQIGSQCWFKQNLNVGNMIPGTGTMNNNGVVEKYCYDDDTLKCNSFGALYQWNEVMQYSIDPGVQGICPNGWHIPTREDYEILIEAAGFDGNSLKAVGQGSGNGAGTNTTGFSAKLAGRRYSVGDFGSLGQLGVFWTSTQYSDFYGIYMHMYNSGKIAGIPDLSKKYGFSVRCVKN